MPNTVDVPLFATAALIAVSGSLTAFGLRRPRHAGWRWWLAALWLTTLGTAAAALLPVAPGAMLAAPLLLQWPLVALVGMRRFQARQPWPGGPRIDAALLIIACIVGALAPLLWAAQGARLLGGCTLATHLYAAAVLFMGPRGREATPVQTLGATIAALAFAPVLVALGADVVGAGSVLSPLAQGLSATLQAQAATAALGALVLAFVAMTLVFERTERQLRESRQRLRLLANLDALTQVPNRRHFTELAGRALRSDPAGSAVLLLFDVDHFKRINDHLGPAAGDRALCLVAGSVLEHLRAQDVAGRHDGDAFVLLLRRATTRDAMGVAARVAAAVQRRAEATPLPPLSLSFGLAQVEASGDLESALRRADGALDEARRQGRSRAVAATGDGAQPAFVESQSLDLQPC